MSKKGKGAKRSRQRLARKLLRNQIGYELNPKSNPSKESIRKSVIKALRAEGWNSKYNTPYQRGKFYDEITDKIFKVQSQDMSGRDLRSVNLNISKWRESNEYKRLSSPMESSTIDTPFTNTNGGIDLFEWMQDLDTVRDVNPDFTYEVYVEGTGKVWKGSGSDIAKNKSKITTEAKSTGSYLGGGYTFEVDPLTGTVRLTFKNQ